MERFSGDAPTLTSPLSRHFIGLLFTVTERISNESADSPRNVGCARVSHAIRLKTNSNRHILRMDQPEENISHGRVNRNPDLISDARARNRWRKHGAHAEYRKGI